MHVKFVVLSIKTYYFSAVLLPSPLSPVLLSSRNSATKKVHGDVTSLFSFLLCYPLSVQCVLQWSYLCDLASLRSFQSPLGLQHYSRGRRRRSTAMTKFNFKFFSRICIKQTPRKDSLPIFFYQRSVTLHGTIRNDDFKRNTALQCWSNVVTIRNNVATMLQRYVALKIVFANRLM